MTTPALLDGHEKVILHGLMNGHPDLPVCVDDFASPPNVEIFRSILELKGQGIAPVFLAVQDNLTRRGKLMQVGGVPGFTQLAGLPTDDRNINHALGEVLEASGARRAVSIGKRLEHGKINRIEAEKELTELNRRDAARSKPLIEFRSPIQLKNFVPPPGLVLVGDNHIVRGSVFVIGGAPGVGKSRASVGLAEAGAHSCDWFGLTVHRKFKTMIVQTENGEFRLASEFTELNCDALEDSVRVCIPPPYGLCFGRHGFREQLSAAVADFAPDVVVFDPWNAAAREQDSREYLNTFEALKSVLPLGDNMPALCIVAHTRKPKAEERHSGRALLNLLAGSYVLGSVPRTVFVMQAASDDTADNRVVWTCAKNNDGELGARSAWERRNGLFMPVPSFDWEAFDQPHSKTGVKPQILRELLERNRQYDRAEIVSIIREETAVGKSRAYELIQQAKVQGVLRLNRTVKTYALI